MSVSTAARFVTGSTLRHVLVMTATSSIGLMSVFFVDVLNLLYISMLGKQQLAAAIGYSGTLMFFLTSVAIGLTIATGAQVSRALGQENSSKAAELGGAGLILMAVTMAVLSAGTVLFARPLTALMGAQGETLVISVRFLNIVVPSMPLMAVGMSAAALLRAKGDAKRAMYVTLSAAFVTAALDPVFIFAFNLGIDGAAIVTIISRIVLMGIGIYGVVRIHNMLAMPSREALLAAAKPYFAIGIPAVMTQLATPVGNAWVTAEMAKFGDDAVAAWAIIGRVTPVAFGAIFALSGAVGPIVGQNYGARRFDRVQSTMYDSFKVVIVYVLVVWFLLAVFRNPIGDVFGATSGMRDLMNFFFIYGAGSFIFAGLLFVANAAFNNLGFALYSTIANWSRATLGVIPFVSLGALWYGPEGALGGSALGTVIFGLGATFVCLRVLKNLEARMPPKDDDLTIPPAAHSPFSTGKAATLG